MSQLINVSDEIYARLTALKKIKNESYTRLIAELLGRNETKVYTLTDVLNEIRAAGQIFQR